MLLFLVIAIFKESRSRGSIHSKSIISITTPYLSTCTNGVVFLPLDWKTKAEPRLVWLLRTRFSGLIASAWAGVYCSKISTTELYLFLFSSYSVYFWSKISLTFSLRLMESLSRIKLLIATSARASSLILSECSLRLIDFYFSKLSFFIRSNFIFWMCSKAFSSMLSLG